MLAHVGLIWAHAGLMLDSSGLVSRWTHLGSCWTYVGLIWAHAGLMLVSCWTHQGSCWAHAGLIWAHAGLMLDIWAPGLMLDSSGLMLGSCWTHAGLMQGSCWTPPPPTPRIAPLSPNISSSLRCQVGDQVNRSLGSGRGRRLRHGRSRCRRSRSRSRRHSGRTCATGQDKDKHALLVSCASAKRQATMGGGLFASENDTAQKLDKQQRCVFEARLLPFTMTATQSSLPQCFTEESCSKRQQVPIT